MYLLKSHSYLLFVSLSEVRIILFGNPSLKNIRNHLKKLRPLTTNILSLIIYIVGVGLSYSSSGASQQRPQWIPGRVASGVAHVRAAARGTAVAPQCCRPCRRTAAAATSARSKALARRRRCFLQRWVVADAGCYRCRRVAR